MDNTTDEPPVLQAHQLPRPMPRSSLGNGDGGGGGGDGMVAMPVISLEAAQPVRSELLVADLLRTGYCVPGSVLLVEAVDVAIPVARQYRMVRLLLGDGALCIQALLSADLHAFVDEGLVYAGCYVRLDLFSLRWVMADEDFGAEHAERRDGAVITGHTADHLTVPYLLLEDITPVGWNRAYMKLLEGESDNSRPSRRSGISIGQPVSPSQPTSGKPVPAPRQQALPVSAGISDAQQEATSGPTQSTRPRAGSTQHNLARHSPVNPPLGHTQADRLPWISADPTQPVKLTCLSSIPFLPYKQNWMINVLAVVVSLGELEPSYLPPYQQRTARLVDSSTQKQVLLTVFLDPDEFLPTTGSVVLLLGVKNHLFDGGSLRKYASDRPRGDSSWWFEDPDSLEWCDVAGMRSWWQRASPTTSFSDR